MPRIKIEMDYDIHYATPILKVEYYKTEAVYYHPIEHPNECFNCASAIDLNDPTKPNQFDVVKKLLQVVEISVNQLLNFKDIPPLDEMGEMKMEIPKEITFEEASKKAMQQCDEALKRLATR